MLGWFSTRCSAVQPMLVAWIDGGLTGRSARQVAAHLQHCRACASEAQTLRTTIAAQREMLQSRLSAETVDVDRLWQQFSRRARTVEHRPARREFASWLWRPALAFAVASGLLWVGSTAFEGPAAILISVGVKAPPPKLTQQPDLFKDYAIIQELDVLEHFDTAGVDLPDGAVTPAADEG